jgi:hypothetical protein
MLCLGRPLDNLSLCVYYTIYLSSSIVVVDHRFPCGRSYNNVWYILHHFIIFFETLFDTWEKNVLRLG